MKKISLCIPTWNRTDLLIKSFAKVIDDERVGEIVISDDGSDEQTRIWLYETLKYYPKVRFFQNTDRLGVYGNKRRAVEYAENEYVILFDSDNIIDKDYLDALYKHDWHETTILAPDFAKPEFDYTAFGGKWISKRNVHEFIGRKNFNCLLNTMNFFIHREEYLRVWEEKDVDASDSIWFNYLWLHKGNYIYVVPDMQYFHLVHGGSNYKQSSTASKNDCTRIELMIKNLR